MPISRNQNSAYAVDNLVASGVQTASGVSVAQSGFSPAKNLVIQLDVTTASGTSPTSRSLDYRWHYAIIHFWSFCLF